MVRFLENWKNPKNPEKSGKIQKPDKIPEIKIFISHLRSTPSILLRNMIKITEIWRFEKKSDDWWMWKKKKKK